MAKKRKLLASWVSAEHKAKQRNHETVRLANLALDTNPVRLHTDPPSLPPSTRHLSRPRAIRSHPFA